MDMGRITGTVTGTIEAGEVIGAAEGTTEGIGGTKNGSKPVRITPGKCEMNAGWETTLFGRPEGPPSAFQLAGVADLLATGIM